MSGRLVWVGCWYECIKLVWLGVGISRRLVVWVWFMWGALTYLNMVGNFHSIDPCFWYFSIPSGPFLWTTRSYWPPLSAEKIGLSLSHLVPEIIWPKVGLIFHTYLTVDHFKAFCTNFRYDFRSYWHPFLQFLDLFDPSFLQKNLDPVGSILSLHAGPLPIIWWNAPPPCMQGQKAIIADSWPF